MSPVAGESVSIVPLVYRDLHLPHPPAQTSSQVHSAERSQSPCYFHSFTKQCEHECTLKAYLLWMMWCAKNKIAYIFLSRYIYIYVCGSGLNDYHATQNCQCAPWAWSGDCGGKCVLYRSQGLAGEWPAHVAKLSLRFAANCCLALRLISLNLVLHWVTVLQGPEQHGNQTCYLLSS